MDKEILRGIGLTDNEVEIYLALLRHGPCLVSKVVEATSLNRTHCYDRLEKLIGKGLAGYVIKENRKYFSAASPERLMDFLNEKQSQIESQKKSIERIIPELNSIKKPAEQLEVEIFRGPEGAKAMTGLLLKSREKVLYAIGYTGKLPTIIPVYYEQWTKSRVKLGIRRKYVVSSEVLDFPALKKPLTEYRVLPKIYSFPTSTIITDDISLIYFIEGKQFVGIAIKSPEIARTNKAFFDFLWKNARKPAREN